MESLQGDASGTPLLVRKQETTIDMEPAVQPSMIEECEPGDRSGFAKKKLSMSRNVNLAPIIVQAPTVQYRNSPLSTSQDNSPLRPYSGHQGLRSADLQHAYKSILSIRVFLPHLFKEEVEDNASTCVKLEVNRATTAKEITGMIAENQRIDKEAAQEAFALWMTSPLLELQLKPEHQPCELRKSWSSLLLKFAADATPQNLQNDEPLLFIKRRVQLAPEKELELADDPNPKILELLYVDAKCNLFAERFFMDSCDAAALAGLGYAIEYKDTDLTVDYVRKNLEGQLPERFADGIRGPMMFGKSLSNGKELDTVFSTWRENKGKSEQELKKLYLAKLHKSCQQYGSAFFHGFIERPSVSPLKNLKRFFQSVASGDADMPITIGINRETITVVDSEKNERILVVQIADCVWKKVLGQEAPSTEDLEPTQPSLLLHFPEFEGPENKLNRNQPSFQVLQIFGYQTALIHCMLSNMHDLLKNGTNSEPSSANSTSSSENEGRIVNRTSSLTKCDRMCLATFVNGECVKANGSMKKIMQKVDSQKVGRMQSVH